MMPSSNQRAYARFIPSEEVGSVTQWKFCAIDGSGLLAPEAEPEPEAEIPLEMQVAAQQALVQQARDDAYAEGLAQGQAQTALEWHVENSSAEASSVMATPAAKACARASRSRLKRNNCGVWACHMASLEQEQVRPYGSVSSGCGCGLCGPGVVA